MGNNSMCTSVPGFQICDRGGGEDLGAFHEEYALGQELGKGAQGKVYLCRVRASGRLMAVKIFDRANAKALATFKRELEFLQAHVHKNIIQVLDDYLGTDYCYLVMERLSCNLRKGMKWICHVGGGAAALGNDSLRNIVQQSFAAVLHLHQRQVIHRDVKAQNLLVDKVDVRDGRLRVVLIDFGFAQYLAPGKVLTSRCGTRKYWPPEVFDGRYWHAMDIFALGVIGFLTSTGDLPFPDEKASRERDIFADGAVPAHVDSETRNFLRKCLEKDPQKRPTADQLATNPWLVEPVSMQERTPRHSGEGESSSSDSEFNEEEGEEAVEKLRTGGYRSARGTFSVFCDTPHHAEYGTLSPKAHE